MKTAKEIKQYVQDNIRVHKSNGNIYHSCPYIDEIILFLENSIKDIGYDMFEKLVIKLETIRKINENLRMLDGADMDISDTYDIVMKSLKDYAHWQHRTCGVRIVEYAIDKIDTLEKENDILNEKVDSLQEQIDEYEKE